MMSELSARLKRNVERIRNDEFPDQEAASTMAVAADALDAKDERIKILERRVRFLENENGPIR